MPHSTNRLESDLDTLRFVDDYRDCADSFTGLTGPTGIPDELFGVRLVGSTDNHVAADTHKPQADANPGWLTVALDLLLARAALGGCSITSAVTLRMDLNVHAPTLWSATSIRGIGRRSFTSDALSMSTAEFRTADGALVATGMGAFVAVDVPLPHPYVARSTSAPSASLSDLLHLEIDHRSGTGTLPTGDAIANPSGVTHGGVQAAALCEAIARVTTARLGEPVGIVNVGVEFLKPLVADNSVLQIGVRERRLGRAFGTVEAELAGTHGVGTRATATLSRPNRPSPEKE